MVGVLVVAFVFSIADRIIIALLVEPIKVDLELTDSDMGLMMGPAFALFYALMGLPIGRAVDKHSRRAIVGAGIFLWSIMTALCGLSRNFWELFLARVGVGVGEATLSPAAYSMIADSFPKEKLGKALGVYQSGAFFGVGFALIFGGLAIQFAQTADNFGLPLVGEVKPWQLAFIAVGLPGVLVAAIMFLVKEPIRQGIASVEEDDISLGQAFRFAFRRWRVFIAHYTGFALLALPMTTLATWVPSYLIRVVGMTPPETGFKLGLIVLIFSPVGVIFGGALADSLFKKGYTDAALRVAVGAALFMIPVSFLATTMDSSASLALALACPFAFGASISMGLAPTALQLVTPNRLRGQIGAAWMLFLNIITAALGPWAVGVINDAWFGDPLAVGQSIAAVNTFAVLVGGIVLRLTWAPFRKAVEQQSID
jgi:MFS family permease